MNQKQILLNHLIQEIIGDPNLDLTTADNLLTTGLVDSMNIMKFIRWISDEFKVEIPPQDMTVENFISIDAISDYLNSK
jgi:acyl carrier protein